MSAKVKISFVKRHRWHRPLGFDVYHDEGAYALLDDQLNGEPIPLWRYSWEKAGFGHGRFGYGSFGWAQGGLTSGGFGFGKFGSGEFGYYNEIAEWTTPKAYRDGLHQFTLALWSTNRRVFESVPVKILIMSTPADPPSLELASMQAGQVNLRWAGSEDLRMQV